MADTRLLGKCTSLAMSTAITVVVLPGKRVVHVCIPSVAGGGGGTLLLRDFKAELSRLVGVPPARLRLTFSGRELTDDARTLESHGVTAGTTLYLLPPDADAVSSSARLSSAAAAAPWRTLQQVVSRHKRRVQRLRRCLLGVRFVDVQVLSALGSGCSGTVLDARARGVRVAVKLM